MALSVEGEGHGGAKPKQDKNEGKRVPHRERTVAAPAAAMTSSDSSQSWLKDWKPPQFI